MNALHQIVLTGCAGTLGRVLEPALRAACDRLVCSDLAGPLAAHGPADGVACDLADATAVQALLRGAGAVVHFGGVSVEGPFEPILQANIRGLVNLYEAARLSGTRRIVFASSNHVTGCYAQGEPLRTSDSARPDGYYGLSKLFGEGLASLYHDRCGIESVCLRIGTALPEPVDRRSLSTWLSPADLVRLVHAALTAPQVGCLVAYGTSNNPRSWWDSRLAWARLNYQPQDSAEDWADRVGHITAPEGSPMQTLQGGSFLGLGEFESHPGRGGAYSTHRGVGKQ